MNISKSLTKVSAAVIGLMLMGVIALWQFYHFVTFKGSQGLMDVQGGTHHLWWAVGAAILACICGFLVFSFFVRYDEANDMHITS